MSSNDPSLEPRRPEYEPTLPEFDPSSLDQSSYAPTQPFQVPAGAASAPAYSPNAGPGAVPPGVAAPTNPLLVERAPRRGLGVVVGGLAVLVALVVAGSAAFVLLARNGDDQPGQAAASTRVSGSTSSETTPANESVAPPTQAPGAGGLRVEGPRSAVVGEAVTFTAQAPSDDGSIVWSFDGDERLGEVVTYAWDSPGEKSVEVTAQGVSSVSVREFSVTVTDAATDGTVTTAPVDPNALKADFTWTPEDAAAGTSIRLVDRSTGNPARYDWRWDNSVIVTSNPNGVTTTFSENTDVTLTVCRDGSANDCDSITKTVTVR